MTDRIKVRLLLCCAAIHGIRVTSNASCNLHSGVEQTDTLLSTFNSAPFASAGLLKRASLIAGIGAAFPHVKTVIGGVVRSSFVAIQPNRLSPQFQVCFRSKLCAFRTVRFAARCEIRIKLSSIRLAYCFLTTTTSTTTSSSSSAHLNLSSYSTTNNTAIATFTVVASLRRRGSDPTKQKQ